MIDPNEGLPPDEEVGEPEEGEEEEPEDGAGVPAGPAPSFQRLDLSLPASVDRSRLAARLSDEVENYLRVTTRRRDASMMWRQAYETMPPGTANRWDNSSDVPSSFTRTYVDSHTWRLDQQIGDPVPPYAVVAGDRESEPYAEPAGDCMWAVLTGASWPERMHDIDNEVSLTGNCFVKVTYEQKIERHPRVNVDYDHRRTIRHARDGGDPASALWAGVKGVKLEQETVVAYQGPVIKVIPWEDGVVLPPTVRDPRDAYGIGEIYMLRGEELVRGARQGLYDEEEVERLLQRMSDITPEHRRDRMDVQGLSEGGFSHVAGMGKEDRLYREYQCVELCWKMDVDGDGLMEWVVVVMHMDSRIILRLQYLPYEHGRPYYQMMRYIIRPGELFGMGIAELISAYHNADTAVLNQIIDHGDLALNWNGNVFYDGTAGYYPDRFVLQLGRGVRVENLGGIKPVQPMALPAEHYQLHAHFKNICDTLTATSNVSLGKESETSRTLGEMQMVQSAIHQAFERHAAGMAWQYADLWDQVRWLVSQYGVGEDGEIEYRRTPAPDVVEFKKIPPRALRAKLDFVPAGLKQMADMGTRVQLATMVRNAMLGDPLVQSNVPAKLILNEEYLKSMQYPQRERFMAEVRKGVEAHQAVQGMEMQMGGGSPLLGGGGPAAPGGAVPPAGAPALPGAGAKRPAGKPAPPAPAKAGGGVMG